VYALDAETGNQIWKAYPGVDIGISAPTVASGSVIVTGTFGTQGLVYVIGGTGDEAALQATPAPSFDISDLPPCVTFRASPDGPVAGTPSNTIATPPASSQGLGVEISPSDVPEGEAAAPEDVEGITATLRAMANCNRADTLKVLSFYSDDYFRRRKSELYEEGQAVQAPNPGVSLAITGSEESQVLPVEDARQLPDGRIGVLFMPTEGYGQFIVFAKQDDHWLVDETLQVVPVPYSAKG
jgi:hypothetical protein